MRGQRAFFTVSGVVLFSLNTIFAESEVNDNAATANSLTVNVVTNGRLGDSLAPSVWDTYDWYSVTTPADGKLTIKTSASGGLDIQPYIYRAVFDMNGSNPGGDWASPEGDATNDSVTGFLRAGTVYVQLIRRSGSGPYSITPQFTPAALANDAEMNDTTKMAMILDVNTSKTGHLGYYSYLLQTDGVDWYKVQVPSDGRLVITTATSGGNLDIQPYIYRAVFDTNGTNPGGDWYSPVGDSIRDTVSNALHAGMVWIQVHRRAGVGSYEIKCAFSAAALTNDSEINDTPLVAQAISMNAQFTGHMGYYSNKMSNDSYDWFKFTIQDEGKVTLTSVTSDGNLDLHYYIYRAVYDSSSSNPAGDYVGSAGDTVADTAADFLRAGTYYVQVVRSRGVGSYTFVTTFTQALYTRDAEPNNTPAQSIPLAYNAVLTGRLGYYEHANGNDSYEWYSITVPATCTLKVVTVTTGTLLLHPWIYSTVNDMNASNPSGSYVSGKGNGTKDTVSIYAVPGTTYFVQIVRSGGVGSYVIASGSAEPVVGILGNNEITPEVRNPGTIERYELSSNVPLSIRIFDLQGRLVYRQSISTKKYKEFFKQINAANLKRGFYMVEVISNGKRNIKRLQILK